MPATAEMAFPDPAEAGISRRVCGQEPPQQSLCLSAWLLGNFTNWLLLASEVGGCGEWNIPLGHRFRAGLVVGDSWGYLPSEKLFVDFDWGLNRHLRPTSF